MLTTGSPKEDMATLYNNFQYPDGELRNYQEFITLNPQSSDLSRYRTATGPQFDGFLTGDDGARGGIIDGFNGSNISRQNSSPPTFASNLVVNNGFSGGSKPSTSNINFSLGSMYMPQMPDSDGNSERGKRQYSSAFQSHLDEDQRSYSLVDSPYSMVRNTTRVDVMLTWVSQNATRVSGLTHHLSLPVPMEKALNFGDSVPYKMHAKRGCATHPRSIAERVRRTRISERMRKLQDLFPDMDKNTSTADMLEMAVEHIKELQSQVKSMSEIKARCTCPRMQKQGSV